MIPKIPLFAIVAGAFLYGCAAGAPGTAEAPSNDASPVKTAASLDKARELLEQTATRLYRPGGTLRNLQCRVRATLADPGAARPLLPREATFILWIDFENVALGHFSLKPQAILASSGKQLTEADPEFWPSWRELEGSLRWVMAAFFWLPSMAEFLPHVREMKRERGLWKISFQDFAAVSVGDELMRFTNRAVCFTADGEVVAYEFQSNAGTHRVEYEWEPFHWEGHGDFLRLRRQRHGLEMPAGKQLWTASYSYAMVERVLLPASVDFSTSSDLPLGPPFPGKLASREIAFEYSDYVFSLRKAPWVERR